MFSPEKQIDHCRRDKFRRCFIQLYEKSNPRLNRDYFIIFSLSLPSPLPRFLVWVYTVSVTWFQVEWKLSCVRWIPQIPHLLPTQYSDWQKIYVNSPAQIESIFRPNFTKSINFSPRFDGALFNTWEASEFLSLSLSLSLSLIYIYIYIYWCENTKNNEFLCTLI